MYLRVLFPFLSWLRLVNKESIKADMLAGFTGAVIVLPQGVAFATIAGLPPQYGLYTAMVTPIVAALFGSSKHLISGPTTAISIVIFSAINNYAEPGTPEFISLALTITFLAGVYQLAFGLARLGAIVNFVSHTVVIGFTAGAAILIATSQAKNIFGITVPRGESFLHTWVSIGQNIDGTNLIALLIAISTLVVVLGIKRYYPKIPNLLVGLVIGSVIALFFSDASYQIELIPEIPGQLPDFSMPIFSFETLKMLAPEAFAVALLGLIEAVSISRAIASKSNQQINSSQEFIGQGLSNMVSSFFSSYAGSGSFTRSGINYEAGAKTPMSAIFAALFLMLIVLLIAPLTAYLPTAAMGGVILVVAYNLIDFHHIKMIFKNSKSETAILLTTFFATLLLELEFAIYLGVLLSLLIFLSRTSTPEIATLAFDQCDNDKRRLINVTKKPILQCPQLKIIRIDMSIYFGSLTHIQARIHRIVDNENIKHILIVGTGINFIDISGAQMLVTEATRLKKLGGGLYFTGLKSNVYEHVSKSCLIQNIGNKYFSDKKSDAVNQIYKSLDKNVCENCECRVFNECE